MKREDPLFALIHSMTNSEKRYFKLTAEDGSGEKKYLVLFEAIARQETYDEAALRRKLKGERFLNELHVAKHYLFEQILKSLRGYFGEHTAYQKLLSCAQEVDVLYRRGLHSLALKRLQKMKQLAKKYHHLSLWLHAVEREQIFLSNSVLGAKQASDLKQEIEYLLDQIETKKNFDEIAFSSRDALFVTSANKNRLLGLEKQIRSMQSTFELASSDPRTCLSFHRMNSRFYLLQNDPKQALPYLKATVELLEANRPMVQEGYFNLYVALYEYYICLRDLSFEPAPEFLHLSTMQAFVRKMELSLDPRNGEDHQVRLRNCIMEVRSSWCIFVGEYQRGLRYLLESRKLFKQVTSQTTPYTEIAYCHNFTRIHFGLGEYGSALEWANKLLGSESLKSNTSLTGWARIMLLVILFELGEYEYVARQIKPLSLYLKKYKHYPEYELLVIQSLKSLIAIQKKKKPLISLGDLLKEFMGLRKNNIEAGRFLEFEFDWWLESKITDIPYSDIVRGHRNPGKKYKPIK